MRIFILALSLWVSLTVATMAQSHALLVGIDKYQTVPHLSGAVADAVELKKLLHKHGIHNTTLLLDDQANKQSIITTLKTIAHTIKKGDNFYMFFSGHGTSLDDKALKPLFDKDRKLLRDMENSGALLPYDFDKESASRSLIIGSRDLRPLFEQIDGKGVSSLVVFDACFSGRTYRSIPSKQKQRKHYTLTEPISFNVKESHPYQNLVYVASTASADWAVEDKKTKRGYLMQQIEQCLEGSADSNGDMRITKLELKQCIENSNLPQSPQIYPAKTEINPYLFKVYKPQNSDKPKQNRETKLQVTMDKGRYIVRDKFGVVASFADKESLTHYQEAYKIIQLQGQKQFSLLALNQKGVKQKNYTVDDEISITIQSSREGYLVLFDLDTQGNLFMVEPYPDKVTPITKNQRLSYTRLTISTPVGTEMMKGFIISDPEAIKRIQQLSPSNDTGLLSDSKALYQLLRQLPRHSYDTALLKLTTHKK